MQMGVCTCTHLYAEVKNAFQHTVETESGWAGMVMVVGSGLR